MPKRIIQQSDTVMAAALVDYQNPDMTSMEVAVKHNVSPATLTVWARKAGLPLRNRGRKAKEHPSPRQLEIVKLASVYTYEQVGERFGMAKQSVHRIIKRWRKWMAPVKPPFERGDMLLWGKKKFTVLEANNEDGTLVDEQGKVFRNFAWNGGRIPKKIGVNPHYIATKRTAARKRAVAA